MRVSLAWSQTGGVGGRGWDEGTMTLQASQTLAALDSEVNEPINVNPVGGGGDCGQGAGI